MKPDWVDEWVAQRRIEQYKRWLRSWRGRLWLLRHGSLRGLWRDPVLGAELKLK